MNSELRELVNGLKKFLADTRYEKAHPVTDPAAREADLLWAASRFWAGVIHKAEPLARYQSHEEFKQFKSRYENDHHIVIDDVALFARYWLRNVLGFIEISVGIQSLCFRFAELKDYKNELLFWIAFQAELNEGEKLVIVKSELDRLVTDYEKSNHITLQTEGIFFKRWASVKEGNVTLSDFQVYFRQYIDHWDDFAFLCAFNDHQNKQEDKGLFITALQFEEMLRSFSNVYPQIPSIEIFLEEKIITQYGAGYLINFKSSVVGYWEVLKDKITGYAWELTIKDGSFSDDKIRLKNLLTKTVCWHWPDPLQYSSLRASTRFLDAAFDLVVDDTDLDGTADEFAKVCFDGRMSHDSLAAYNAAISSAEYALNNSDQYELLESFNRWEKRAHTTYLYSPNSRNFLAYLINIIVLHDDEFYRSESSENVDPVTHFKRIKSLLRASVAKPYLVWEVSQPIVKSRPEIIAYLFVEPDLSTLPFIFLDDLVFLPDQSAQLNLQLWDKSIHLFLHGLSRDNLNEAAKKILQVFRQLNSRKYEIPYYRGNRAGEIQAEASHDNKERLVLSLIENSNLHPYLHNRQDSYFFLPVLYNDLVSAFLQHAIQPLYQNGTVQFPIMQWDGMSWLLRVSTYWKYKAQPAEMEAGVHILAKEFLRRYLESIEVNEIKKYNYFEDKEQTDLPLWSEKIERLQFVNWIFPIYFINRDGLLGEFLSPRIHFESTVDQYHKKNNFSADKLRTHIGVLLQILRQLIMPAIPYGFEKEELKKIKEQIEYQINEYLKQHVKDEPKKGRIDLFNFNREWRFKDTEGEALFPQIARAINWFSDKDTIINSISESGDISKLLTLLNFVTSQGVRQKLIMKIRGLDIISFLEQYNWIPEIQYSFISLTRFPELIDQIEAAILFWKDNIIKRPKNVDVDYKMTLYQAELIAAYFKKDEKQIEQITVPKQNYQNRTELSPYNYKEFYKGLLAIQKNPPVAHRIFDELVKQYPTYATFGLNRMVAKINQAELAENLALYREALEEWKEIEKRFDAYTKESLEPGLSINVLTILNKLSEYKTIDERYRSLDLPNQMQPDILGIVINSLVTQKRTDEAFGLVDAAKAYHEFADVLDIQFIKDLEAIVNGIDNIEELKGHYLRIYSCDAKKLIKIFPEQLNGKLELNQFIVKEIILATDKMLEKIKSIAEIKSEDKYNDIVEMALDARINTWGWHVGAQSRGGYSAPASGSTGKQPGERDLPIMNSNKQVLMVCEAWIYRGKTNAGLHLQKVFNYDHKKETFAVLIYDTGERGNDFEANWKEYADKIVPSISFPQGLAIKDEVTDVCKNFDFEKSAIKIGASEHGTGTIIYHIFVNINYRI